MGRRLWFLTSNEGKLREVEHHLSPLGWDVEQMKVDDKVPEVIEPQASTLEEVAASKLQQAVEIFKVIGKNEEAVLVEDAGLFIDALSGFPGVYSAYTLNCIGCEGILRLMGDERSAHFAAVAMLWDGRNSHLGRGRCDGRIAERSTGSEGFGFDPIFIPDDMADGSSSGGLSFAALPLHVKQRFSHRGDALDDLFSRLA